MARRRRGRQIDGILLLDKPAGISSNQALQKARRLLNANKAGHTGNLDGPATGLLPLCFGEATKMSTYLLDERKRYLCEVQLGQTTTTLDAEGDLIESRPIPSIDPDEFEHLLDAFRGPITQIPPMYSALKHQGERLYKLAQQGEEIERKPRPVTIYSLEVVAFGETGFTIDVACSKGTYIRTLADDIGQALGCGAHVKSLRRTEVGEFTLQEAVTLEQLEAAIERDDQGVLDQLLPVDAGLALPKVEIASTLKSSIQQGQEVALDSVYDQGLSSIYTDETEFLGIGEVKANGRLAPKRLIVTNK